jgi:acetyltransferase-like isoleucine patch superfamily enzyme
VQENPQKESAWSTLLRRSRESPFLILPGLLALLNGYYHKIKFLLLFKNVKIGKAFRVYGKLNVTGPGKVTIGDNCVANGRLFGEINLHTVLPHASITIGHHVGMNGTKIQCFKNVTIEDYSSVANAYLIDSTAHRVESNRRDLPIEDVETSEILLKYNCWVSANVVITKGVTIGKNSVIGACSLVREDVPDNSLYAGNPAKLIKEIS